MPVAEVHTLYETNARSIPDMLRTAAESIEAEVSEGYSPTVAMVAVQLAENGEIKLYGWGETEIYHSLALLARGQHDLLTTLAEG